MRKRLFALLAILTLILTGCGGDYTTVFTEVNMVEGVTIALAEDTLKGAEATFVITNASEADVLIDPVEYHLEKKSKDGVWEENVGTRASQWKRDTTETIPAGGSVEKAISWKGLCGTIGGGTYRMILIVNDQPIACEFEK